MFIPAWAAGRCGTAARKRHMPALTNKLLIRENEAICINRFEEKVRKNKKPETVINQRFPAFKLAFPSGFEPEAFRLGV